MPELWTPAVEGPHDAFVERLHRVIARFAHTAGVQAPVVEIELADTARFVLERIEPEPGFGMVTLYVGDSRDDGPDVLVVPIGSIRRIELRKAPEERLARFGFAVPAESYAGAGRARARIRRPAATSHGATSSAITSNQT